MSIKPFSEIRYAELRSAIPKTPWIKTGVAQQICAKPYFKLSENGLMLTSTENYNKIRQELIIAAITSNIERKLLGETVLKKWEEAGLLYLKKILGFK